MTRHRSSAFSLLELVLVLVIIGIAMAVVTPSLGGWSRGMKLRTQGDELLAATRLARDRAVTTATPHALIVEGNGSGWRVEAVDLAAETRGPASASLGAALPAAAHLLPEGWTFAIESPSGEALERAVFYPDDRGDPAILILTSDRGESVAFERVSLSSGFVRAEGALR